MRHIIFRILVKIPRHERTVTRPVGETYFNSDCTMPGSKSCM